MLASLLFLFGLSALLVFLWVFSRLWLEQRAARRRSGSTPMSRLTTIKPKSAFAKMTARDWVLIILVAVPTAILTRLPVLTIGSAVILYLTRTFFGKDPMEARLKSMEDNITWMQTLTYLLQTSKTAWESLQISTKALPDDTAAELRASLNQTNGTLGGYVIRLRDALTLFAIKQADPQIDLVVAMVNANISTSGGNQDYTVMHTIQAQLKSELVEQDAAVSARREIFTIAKIMFPAVVIMESSLAVMMGNFILPYYQTAQGTMVTLIVELLTIGLLFLFRKFSAPLPETRLIVPQTFLEALKRQTSHASGEPKITTEGIVK